MGCNICGNNSTRHIFRVEELGKAWDIYECLQCLTQFILPIPTVEDLKGLYDEHYAENSKEGRRLRDPKYGRLSFPRQWGIIKKLANKKYGRILDYGCGGGHFLDRVSDDWQKYGVEISEVARAVAKGKGIKVFSSIGENSHRDYFDVVTMFATIEHLPNPREVVSQLSESLKVGGLFVVMTGDVGSLKANIQGERWHLYTPPGHIYFFTAHSVDYLMESLGFRKVKSLYTDGGVTRIPFMPLNVLLRIGLEVFHRIPLLNTIHLLDTYYGYYRKEG